MASVRIFEATGTSPTTPLLRVAAVEGAGAAAANPHLRVFAVSGVGVASAALTPLTPLTVEPLSTVELEAVPLSGAVPDTYTWRRVGGAAVSLVASGSTCTFTAPAAMPPGATVTIGVRATAGGIPGAEQQVVITALPQLTWTRVGTGPWTAARVVVG